MELIKNSGQQAFSRSAIKPNRTPAKEKCFDFKYAHSSKPRCLFGGAFLFAFSKQPPFAFN